MLKSLKNLAVAVGVFFGLVGTASAAIPESVTTAITTATTDVGTAGAAILGVVIAIVAFAWIRRVLK